MAVSTPYEKTGEISCSENLTGCGQSIREVTRMTNTGGRNQASFFSSMALSWGGVSVSRLNSVRKYRPTTNSSMAGQDEGGAEKNHAADNHVDGQHASLADLRERVAGGDTVHEEDEAAEREERQAGHDADFVAGLLDEQRGGDGHDEVAGIECGLHERGLHVAQVEYGLELGDKNVIEACGDGLEGEQHRSH